MQSKGLSRVFSSNIIQRHQFFGTQPSLWVIPEWSSGFPYFIQFKSDFGKKEFMIWATVSSQSCFCWLYNFSIFGCNLISVLTIWWCPCVETSLLLLEKGVCYVFSWQNSISLCPASFRIPRPNLPVTPDISWLPTFAFQSPITKRGYRLHIFWGVSSRRSCRSL